MLDAVRHRASQFDVIHFHTDLLQYPLFQDVAGKCVTTLHGRLDLPEIHPVFRAFPAMPLVSISESQRDPMPPNLNWIATIPHGLPPAVCPFDPCGGEYLAFLGRLSPEKRPDRAIEIAKRARVPLKIAAKIDPSDQDYFDEVVRPLLADPLIEFVGEIDEGQKSAFLGKALALLFPIDWPEPFGLVMIESMSAGTPVIAWRNGSVPEVINDGVSGRIVESVDEAVAAVAHVRTMDRRKVRRSFEGRFVARRMAQRYVEAYQLVLGSHVAPVKGIAARAQLRRTQGTPVLLGAAPSHGIYI
jgi:glycosyltransferase involved in cell wall biosynthesis